MGGATSTLDHSRKRSLPDVGALIWGRPKRPCLADGVSIAKIAKSSTSVSCVLAYAGFETLLDLEALDLTTRRILRRGSFDLRLQLALGAYERNHAFRRAAIVANREDLLAARRAGLLPERLVVYYWTSLSASRTVPSCDVNYDGDDLRGITFKSRRLPRTLARREAVRDADASQSIASLAAFERERLGMIALGYVVVNLAPPADDPAAARAYRRLFHFLNRSNDTYDDSKPRAAAPADAALLVRAMGGPLATPRRLCDAAARRAKPSTLDRASLDRCMRRSAARSAFVDVEALERLVVALAWRIYLDAGVNAVYHVGRAAFGELCVSANVDNADAVWAEVVGGHLLPLSTCYVPRDALGTPSFESLAWRDPGDVRVGDVATVRIYDELIPSVLGFAVTSKARGDAVASFASTLVGVSPWFLKVYQPLHCAILDDLAARRPGEADGEAGAARAAAALASLLEEEHAPRPLAAGDAIEVYDKTADTWRAGALVAASIDDSVSPQLVEGGAALFGSAVSVVVQLDGTHATREWKRSFVRRPLVDALALPRAIVVLGDALREHRNVFAARLLASPLLADALAYRTSGDGNSPLDHAIQGGNGVGVRMLLARYGRGLDSIEAFVSSPSNDGEQLWRANLSPARRVDLYCAMEPLDFNHDVLPPAPSSVAAAAARGDFFFPHKFAATEMSLVSRCTILYARILWKKFRGVELVDIVEVAEASALSATIDRNWGFSLFWASRMGNLNIVKFLVQRINKARDEMRGYINDALVIAVLENRAACLEAILRKAHLSEMQRSVLVRSASEFGNVAALDALRNVGVSLYYEQTALRASSLGDAVRLGQPESVRALLRDKDCLAALREHRSDALHLACNYGHFEVLGVLLEAGGFPLGAEHSWRPQLHGRMEPQIVDGESPLSLAAGQGRSECVVMLLNLGACVDGISSNGRTALQSAVMGGWISIAEILLEAGASVAMRDLGDYPGFSAFQYALRTCDSEQEKMLRLLLRERPDECDLEGSLRHLVASLPEAAAAKLLISLGADPNDESLHLAVFHLALLNDEAARKKLAELIGILVSSGASAAARSTLACNPPERDSGHAIAPPGLTPRELAECGLSLEAREAAISALEDALAKKRRF